ncbi:MAG: glycerophosphodiester phosphodiesterase family protein [Chloroflexota bacterium]
MITDKQKADDLRTALAIRKVFRWFSISILIVLGIHYGLGFWLGSRLLNSPQIIAHRGGPVYQPENTMAAFKQARNDGVDWLEFDVQMTKDGVLVVIHDEMVDRTTNGTGAVADFTFAEIQELDAGNGQRIPTFAEVIEFAKDAGLGILPEAKSPQLYPGIEGKMVEAIVSADYVKFTIIQSFEAATLDAIHEINFEVEVCPLYGLWVLSVDQYQPASAGYVCVMAEMVALNPGMIRDAHAAGLKVFVWFGVLENPFMINLMLDFGADGLMVDDPVELITILRP